MKNMKKTLLFYFILFLIPFNFKSQTPINASIKETNFFPGSIPRGLLKTNNHIVFSAFTGFGNEPYKYNIQTGEVNLIQNINGNSGNSMLKNEFHELNGKIVYFASDNSNFQLWTTDLSTNATSKIKDFNIYFSSSSNIISKVFGNKLYFVYQQKLYVSDGTANGTFQINNVNNIGNYIFENNGYVYFFGHSSGYGREIWKTDGTQIGTSIVMDINPGSNSGIVTGYEKMYRFNNKIFFLATDTNYNLALWSTDGTSTNSFYSFGSNYYLASFFDFDYENYSELFFSFNGNLWKTDGTLAGTNSVYSNIPTITKLTYFKGNTYINTDSNIFYVNLQNQVNILSNPFSNTLQVIEPSDNGNYLALKEFNNDSSLLYFYDGVSTLQTSIKYNNDNKFIENNNKLIFSGYQESYYDYPTTYKNVELFSFQPANNISKIEKDLTYGMSGTPLFFTELNGEVFFLSRDGYYYQVYKIDLAGNLIKLSNNLQDYFPDNIENYYPVAVSGNYIYFHSSNLIRTDAINNSTQIISPPTNETIYGTYAVNNNKIIIKTYNNNDNHMRIWSLDNNSSNFSLLIERPSLQSSGINNNDTDFVKTDNGVYFKIKNNSTSEIWKTDGTISNTIEITDLYGIYELSNFLGALNSKIFYTDNQNFSYNNTKLYYIDETTNQVHFVKDSFYEINQKGFVKNNLLHFFSGTNNGFVVALNSTDGTLQNTQIVTQINSQGAYNITKCGNLHYFVDYNRQNLYRTDGVSSGTFLVTNGAQNYNKFNCNDNLLYGLNSYQKVFKTNGDSGNYQELDFNVDNQLLQQYNWIKNLFINNSRLYFTVDQYSNHGDELFISDQISSLQTIEVSTTNTNRKISLYPNPTSSELNVELNEKENIVRVLILDSSGKHISTHYKDLINVQNLPTGLYFIKVFGTINEYISKFIKK